MIYTTLADVEDLVTAAGLDLDALSLIISEALDEDLGGRGVLPAGTGAGIDVTSFATIPATHIAHGEFVVRQPGTVAGLPVAAYVVASVCAPAGDFNLALHATDGDRVSRGDVLISITGNLHDAISLLWRLELLGEDPGRERWAPFAAIAAQRLDRQQLVFHAVHLAMALAGAGDDRLFGVLLNVFLIHTHG